MGVCAALRACHHADIVHRDLKPSNVFLVDTDTGWEVKVLDFGVSKAAMVAEAEITEDGQIVGTPQYLSPEQVNGKVGPASDQYALGVLLYVCLTKRLPFRDHHGVTLLRAIEAGRFEPPRSLRPELPPGLEAIILRAMANDPRDRFESIHALGQKLWEFASPRGRDQWKNYYFHTPPVARPAKESVHGVPLVEVLVRAGRTDRDEARPPAAAAVVGPSPKAGTPATVVAMPMSKTSVEAPARTVVVAAAAANDAPASITGKPQLLISTKLAVSKTGKTGKVPTTVGGERRWIAIFIGACCGVVLGAGIWFARAEPEPAPVPAVMPASSTPTAPAPETAPATAVTPPPMPAPQPPVAPAADTPSASASPAAPVTRKHATRRRKLPTVDQNGIGIPAN